MIFDNKKNVQNILVASIIINSTTSLLSLIIGYQTNINTLMLDGVHSLSDLMSDIVLLFMISIAYKKRDEKHPYGYERYDNLVSLVIGGMIIFSALPFIYSAYQSLISDKISQQIYSRTALIITIIKIISKEILYHASIRVGKQANSSMLIANGIHHRSDVFSSLLVLVALVGMKLGWTQADSIISLIFAGYLLYVGSQIILDSFRILADRSPIDKVQIIKDVLLKVEGIKGLHALRIRTSGPFLMGDVHLEVDGDLSIREAHVIIKDAQISIRKALPQLRDFIIHVDVFDPDKKYIN